MGFIYFHSENGSFQCSATLEAIQNEKWIFFPVSWAWAFARVCCVSVCQPTKSHLRKMKPIFADNERYFMKIFCIFHCVKWTKWCEMREYDHNVTSPPPLPTMPSPPPQQLVSVRNVINHKMMQKQQQQVNDDFHRNVITVIVYSVDVFFFSLLFFLSTLRCDTLVAVCQMSRQKQIRCITNL